jgi:hypothetical protein
MSKKIKRYYAIKFFSKDLKGPAYAYQYIGTKGAIVGPWHYKHNHKRISCCNNGFHSVLIDSIRDYYTGYGLKDGNRCFIVEINGKVDIGYDKIASEEIRLIKEIKLTKNTDDDIAHITEIANKYGCISNLDCCNFKVKRSGVINLKDQK